MTKRKAPVNHYRTKITPTKAKEWLVSNTHNRPVRPGLVEQLATAMLLGEWRLNGDAIRFDHNGVILDGQHRLLAIVASGVAVESFVIEGLPPEAQDTMDMGRKRLLSDVLALRGEKSALNLAAVINLLYRWNKGNPQGRATGTSVPTVGQALQILDDLGDDLRSAVRHGMNASGKVRISSTIIAACWFKFSELNEEDCRDFWSAVTTGFHLDGNASMPESGPYALARYAARNAMGHNRVPQHVLHALVIKAWNAYRENRKVVNLAWKGGGVKAEQFPVPV